MPVTLRFLVSGDAFGDGGRFQACLLLEGGPAPLMLDCGATSLDAMKHAGVDPSSTGFVAITHLHGDHFGGIPFPVLDGQFNRRDLALVVAGPAGTKTRVLATMEALFPGSSTVERRFPLEFIELVARITVTVGPATVTPFEALHASGAPSLLLRVDYAGKVIGYSGDTERTAALVEVARDADLFVCEAYHAERAIRFHMNYPAIVANRARLGARRVLLTHIGPTVLALPETAFERAYDGLVVELR